MSRPLPRRLRTPLAVAAVLAVVGLSTAACGSDDEQAVAGDSASSTPAATPAPSQGPQEPEEAEESEESEESEDSAATTIDITVADGDITPSGEEVEVGLGEEIDLVVTADAPGEIHVHSDPEATFEYDGTGEPETFSLTIDRPGQVEVESHTLEKLIVNLVVS